MMTMVIPLFVFLSTYTLVYTLYLQRHLRVSLAGAQENLDAQETMASAHRENTFRKVLKGFGFLANIKALRTLVSHSIPRKLVMAGSPLSIVEFVIFKVLSMALCGLFASIILQDKVVMAIVIGVILGFIIPDIWLNLKIQRRHVEIRRDLPAVIDLLNLCVDAGLDFMLAVSRVIREFKKCPITDELSEVWQETRMGAARRDALVHMSRRINLPELSSFVRTLLQADRMGSPMGEALKIQAEEIRMRRYLRGEELALKAPIKLLFPLFFFILPAVMVIVAGPIFLQFMQGGIKF